MTRRKATKAEAWQTKIGAKGEARFIRLHFPLIESAAWKSLPSRPHDLYICMLKARWCGREKRGPTFPDIPIQERGKSTTFYYTWKDARETGLYSVHGERAFDKDRKALVEAGFIDDLAPHISKGNGKAKIYRFSSRWQTYTPPAAKGDAK